MRQNRLRGIVTLFAVSAVALGAVGCGDDNNNSSSAPAAATAAETTTDSAASGTIGVEASEMKFVLTADTAPAGKVTFNAKNVGTVKHEMVVIKTDTPAGELPQKDAEVDETGSIGEIESDDLPPGASASLTRNMKAGHYALICALPGHYQGGMYADFTVE